MASSEPSTSGPQPPKQRTLKRPNYAPPEEVQESESDHEGTPDSLDFSDLKSYGEDDDKKKNDRVCLFQNIFTEEKLKKKEVLKQRNSLKGMIKEAYHRVRMEYEEQVEEDRLQYYQGWLDDKSLVNIYRKNLIERVGPYEEIQVEPFTTPVNGREACITWLKPDRDENNEPHRKEFKPTARIEIGDIRPGMVHWTPIEQSIISEDQLRLTHMPYFNDGQDDNDSYAQLKNLFPDGIHGFAHNWSYINDYLLYRVMRTVLNEYSGNIDIFYYTVYRLWPNKFSQRQLSYIFPKYCAKYAEPDYDWHQFEFWKPEISKNPTIENAAMNIMKPRCYACLEYMCPIHGFVPQIPREKVNGDMVSVFLPLPDAETEASPGCGPRCWKNLNRQTILDHLTPSEEEIQDKRAEIYLDKGVIMEMSVPDGCMIPTLYIYDSSNSFCKFAHDALDGKLDDHHKIRTCGDAYNLIMSLAEYISERRLQLGLMQILPNHGDRANDFRTDQRDTAAELKKRRLAKLEERAKAEKKTIEQVIKEVDEEETKAKSQVKKEKVKLEARKAFIPCHHDGPCGLANEECSCGANGTCSHLCQCDAGCEQRFPGCNCAPGKCQSKSCQCYRANWECNPITCHKCNCDVIDDSGEVIKCRNFGMTRLAQKRMYVAPSPISGNGLFLSEDVEKNGFITEYVGERISDNEAERRGAIYDRFKCSYIFNLEVGGAIDSYKVGNLSRFANHDAVNPTVHAATIVVNGEHRIAFYAIRDLKAGTELTFNYDYATEHVDTVKINSDKKVKKANGMRRQLPKKKTQQRRPSNLNQPTSSSTKPSTSSQVLLESSESSEGEEEEEEEADDSTATPMDTN